MFKIYVGNLAPSSTSDAIRGLFRGVAEIEDIAMAADPKTGRMRNFAVVMIRDDASGREAVQRLRGTKLAGRRLVVNELRSKKKKPQQQR